MLLKASVVAAVMALAHFSWQFNDLQSLITDLLRTLTRFLLALLYHFIVLDNLNNRNFHGTIPMVSFSHLLGAIGAPIQYTR